MSQPSADKDGCVVPKELMERIHAAMGFYASLETYLPPRTGGVAEGCPRSGMPPIQSDRGKGAMDVLLDMVKLYPLPRAPLPECGRSETNIHQAGAMTGTSFEGLKRPSSLDQPHQEAADGSSRNAAEVPESTSVLRGAGASPSFKSQWKPIGSSLADGGTRYYDAVEVDAYFAKAAGHLQQVGNWQLYAAPFKPAAPVSTSGLSREAVIEECIERLRLVDDHGDSSGAIAALTVLKIEAQRSAVSAIGKRE